MPKRYQDSIDVPECPRSHKSKVLSRFKRAKQCGTPVQAGPRLCYLRPDMRCTVWRTCAGPPSSLGLPRPLSWLQPYSVHCMIDQTTLAPPELCSCLPSCRSNPGVDLPPLDLSVCMVFVLCIVGFTRVSLTAGWDRPLLAH